MNASFLFQLTQTCFHDIQRSDVQRKHLIATAPVESSHYLEEESDEEKETREGPQFQAAPPPLRQRGQGGAPREMPAEEAALVSRCLLPPSSSRPPARGALVDLSAMTLEQRCAPRHPPPAASARARRASFWVQLPLKPPGPDTTASGHLRGPSRSISNSSASISLLAADDPVHHAEWFRRYVLLAYVL